MSEAVLKKNAAAEAAGHDVVADHIGAGHAAEVNDNADASHLLAGEARHFEIPARLWYAMIALYVFFIAAMFAATGGGYTNVILVLALGLIGMFFGTTRMTLKHGPVQPRSPLDTGDFTLSTLSGALKEREVATQMLIVPACVAFFGFAIVLIRLWVA